MDVQKVAGYRQGSTYFTCDADAGFFYRKKSYKKGVTYLVCIEKNCPARASCNESEFLKLGDNHIHLPDIWKKEALHLKEKLIDQATSSSNQLKSIFVVNSAGTNLEAAAKIAFPAISQSMRRQRKKTQPGTPATLEEYGMVCQNNLRFGVIDGKPFCRGCVGEGENTSVVFLAEDMKSLLSEAREIHIDGTFKTRPQNPQSSQLLTIMAVQYGIAFPCAFALMGNGKVEAYNGVFSILKEIVPEFDPKLIMTDYEVSLKKSLDENFPNSSKSGCFFHYCQAIMRKAGNIGMNRFLKQNSSAKKALKLMLCLPLLSTQRIADGVQHIKTFLIENRLQEEFKTLIQYHEKQWIRRVGADSFSVFKRSRRTNNDSESFHASLQRILRVRGPNVWEFTDGLRNISAVAIRERRSFIDEGLQIKCLAKRKFRANNKRIKDATVAFLENESVGSFLNMVSYCVETIIQRTLAEEDMEEETEEYLVGPLLGPVSPEYEVIDENEEVENTPDDEHEEENSTEREPEASQGYDRATCIICKDNVPTTVLLPCTHFGLCDDCTEEYKVRNIQHQRPDEELGYVIDYSIFPLDRIPITEFLRVVST